MRFKLTPQAKQYLLSLDKETINRIYHALRKMTATPPIGDIKKLQGNDELFRLRVGGLRILFEVIDDNAVIYKISPRGQAYK